MLTPQPTEPLIDIKQVDILKDVDIITKLPTNVKLIHTGYDKLTDTISYEVNITEEFEEDIRRAVINKHKGLDFDIERIKITVQNDSKNNRTHR